MLLSVQSLNSTKLGTLLEVWYVGGEHAYVKRPFDPYFFSTIRMPKYSNEEVVKKDLATHKFITMHKISFTNTNALRSNADYVFTTDDDVPYVQRVAIDEGFYYPSPLPHHYAFDIETWRGRIQAIAFDGHETHEYSAGNNERANIEFLNQKIANLNPDLLDTYWGSYFDITKTQERAKIHDIKLAWGRNGEEPYIKKRQYRRGPKMGVEHTVRMKGRLHFDVWKEVDMDQTLAGIKDHKLRTVTKWFKFPPCLPIDYDNMDAMSDKDLGEACLSHAHATWLLADMYLHRLYYHADTIGLPLNLLIERTPSHLPNYIYMRDLERLGYIARSNNKERFPQFFNFGRKAYQGAIVRLYQAGIYSKLFHDDFKSMYPTVMGVFNLSSETVRLIDVKHGDFTGLERPRFNGQILTVYDKKVGAIKVEIDRKEGITKKRIREWMKQRSIVKDKLKLHPNDPALESEQYGLKVNLNTIYGYHGMRFARYGCAPIAAIITAIGRWWLWESVNLMENEGCKVIESDTDGIYHVGEDMSKQLTAYIRTLIPHPYDPAFIKVDNDVYDGGIFYEEKGYLLKDGNDIKFHGSGLKGRHMPAICDKASLELAKGLFAGEDVKHILWKYTKLKRRPLADFVMTMELHKDSYVSRTMHGKLIKKAFQYGVEFEQGSEVKYIKCKDGYMPFPLSGYNYEIDYNYYRKRLAHVLARILGPTKRMGKKTIMMIMKEGQMIL
jgi:DNA polymerase elongation subunit (family B)